MQRDDSTPFQQDPSAPPFAVFPADAVSDPRLTRNDYKVLLALCTFRNVKTKRCDPSLKRIAIRAGLLKSAVGPSVRHLEELGHVLRFQQWRETPKGKFAQGTNQYEIRMGDSFYESWTPIPETPVPPRTENPGTPGTESSGTPPYRELRYQTDKGEQTTEQTKTNTAAIFESRPYENDQETEEDINQRRAEWRQQLNRMAQGGSA